MVDRRRFSRERAFKAGTISAPRQGGGTHCVVRDLSSGGALLLMDEPRRAPSEFELTIACGGGVRSARVVWRGETGVGVAFRSGGVHEGRSAVVVSLDDARRRRGDGLDGERLADRIARVLRPRGGGSEPTPAG